jgi:lipopolysaccharide export system protein LptA
VNPRLIATATALVALSEGGALSADPAAADSPEALEMTADHLELDMNARSAVLTGNVRLARAGVVVRCPRVEARYDDRPSVVWLRGSGGVVAEASGLKAEAPELELDLAQKTLELRGGVRIVRGVAPGAGPDGAGWMTAERASIQLATGRISMSAVKGVVPMAKPALPVMPGLPATKP